MIGAGSGIGRASALTFAREGAKVVVVDLDAKGGEETVGRIRQAGGESIFAKADVSKSAEVNKCETVTSEPGLAANILIRKLSMLR